MIRAFLCTLFFLTSAAAQAQASRPNIIFILTDDFSLNLIPYMLQSPHKGLASMIAEGATFDNYFVTNSLCCPSRATIFTGKHPHNSGVWTNYYDPVVGEFEGGLGAFLANKDEQQTFALALRRVGYRTALLGKFLNGYAPERKASTDPSDPGYPEWAHWGWSDWHVTGNGYNEYNYLFNQNGVLRFRGHRPEDYLTDVLSNIGQAIIRSSTGPFFIEISTFNPHYSYTPAPRDLNAFPGVKYPQTPAYNWVASQHPEANAPEWLRALRPLTPYGLIKNDSDFRLRAQSVLALDKLISDIRAVVKELKIEDKTYVIFSSDNGYHMGEFSLYPGKVTAYDTDIRVPLYVVGPGVKHRRISEIVDETDLASTFTDIARMGPKPSPLAPDGRSLLWALKGSTAPVDWKKSTLVEHHNPNWSPTTSFSMMDPDAATGYGPSQSPPNYEALRIVNKAGGINALYVEYRFVPRVGGAERVYYNLNKDPYEITNIYKTLSATYKAQLHRELMRKSICRGGSWNPC